MLSRRYYIFFFEAIWCVIDCESKRFTSVSLLSNFMPFLSPARLTTKFSILSIEMRSMLSHNLELIPSHEPYASCKGFIINFNRKQSQNCLRQWLPITLLIGNHLQCNGSSNNKQYESMQLAIEMHIWSRTTTNWCDRMETNQWGERKVLLNCWFVRRLAHSNEFLDNKRSFPSSHMCSHIDFFALIIHIFVSILGSFPQICQYIFESERDGKCENIK